MRLVCNFPIFLSSLPLSLSKFSLIVSLYLNLFLVEEKCFRTNLVVCICVCVCVYVFS